MDRGIQVMVEVNSVLVINIISLRRLIDGGAAILAAEAINHSVAKLGNRDKSPLVRYRFRVWVDS